MTVYYACFGPNIHPQITKYIITFVGITLNENKAFEDCLKRTNKHKTKLAAKMKKRIAVVLSPLLFLQVLVHANEGMWLPLLIKRLNHVDMQKHGLQLTAEEIYSVNNASIKDAIVMLGGGFCTGEIISSKGLMLTNHHCAYDAIQQHSTEEHDYLTDGFWAMDGSQEIPIEGLTAHFLERMDDVTSDVLKGVSEEMSHAERSQLVAKNIADLKAQQGSGFDVQIKSFFEGNEYYMFKYRVYSDVRLVGAPPSSIGKFGGDTDNWMWPRHTCDFAMFRVYAGQDNTPAQFSKNNQPYKPKHHLPVSLNGVQEDDFAMILGYPGSTDRYLTSHGVKSEVEIEQPLRVKIRRKKLDIYGEGMAKSDHIRIQYASKYAGVSNYWKYFIGQTEQLGKNKVFDKKKREEDRFAGWVSKDAKRQKLYGSVLKDFEDVYANKNKYLAASVAFEEAIYSGPDLVAFMDRNFGSRSLLIQELAKDEPNKKILDKAKQNILAVAKEHFKNYNAEVDKKLVAEMLSMYQDVVPEEFHPAELREIHRKNKKSFNRFATKYFAKSPFVSMQKLEAFLKNISLKKLKKDPMYNLTQGFIQMYISKLMPAQQMDGAKFSEAKRKLIKGYREMNPNTVYAPDANSTMRVTYGNVLPYDPKDGVVYKFITTQKGVLEKEVKTDDKNHEFYVDRKLKRLFEAKAFGQYGEDGNLPICFLTNNDITGGNSGSPVINGKGQLIGCAFDGNWEAMSGDIAFEDKLQRTITVDIRYVLFIIDKFAGATHLVNEMTVINDDHGILREGKKTSNQDMQK